LFKDVHEVSLVCFESIDISGASTSGTRLFDGSMSLIVSWMKP